MAALTCRLDFIPGQQRFHSMRSRNKADGVFPEAHHTVSEVSQTPDTDRQVGRHLHMESERARPTGTENGWWLPRGQGGANGDIGQKVQSLWYKMNMSRDGMHTVVTVTPTSEL